MSTTYTTDLTDAQWAVLAPLLPSQRGAGRPRQRDLRHIINALLYLDHTGCAWRALPSDYPPWTSVRYYFDIWTHDGTWVRVNDMLRQRARGQLGREAEPSIGVLDSQSVKTTEAGGDCGYDAAKKNQGSQAHHAG